MKQLTELLTQYGKVSEVWFDGACGEGPNGKKQVYDFVRWYELIRKLQPEAVIAVMGLMFVGLVQRLAVVVRWNGVLCQRTILIRMLLQRTHRRKY